MITKEEAIEIAKNKCKERDWEWLEPIKVNLYWKKWVVIVGAHILGFGRATIVIDKKSGEIIGAGRETR